MDCGGSTYLFMFNNKSETTCQHFVGIQNEAPPPPPRSATPTKGIENSVNYSTSTLTPEVVTVYVSCTLCIIILLSIFTVYTKKATSF